MRKIEKILLIILMPACFLFMGGLFDSGFWGLSRKEIDTSAILKFGFNSDIDIAAEEDIWGSGGTFTLFPDDSVVEVVSLTINDSIGGTGALTIQVFGIDSSWDRVSETFTMVGQKLDSLVNSYLMIYRVKVVLAGSQAVNDTTIVLQSAGGNIEMNRIGDADGQSLMAIAPVFKGHTAYLHTFYASVNAATAADADIKLWVKPYLNAYQIKHKQTVRSTGSSHFQHLYPIPLKIDEKSLIKMSASTDTDNSQLSAGFDFMIWGGVE